MQTMEILDILILSAIAVFLGFRLRSILGRRVGHQESPKSERAFFRGQEEARKAAQDPSSQDDILLQKDNLQKGKFEQSPQTENERVFPPLQRIREQTEGFTEKSFLQGAEMAFEEILSAFAKGELNKIRRLVSSGILQDFIRKTKARRKRQRSVEHTLVQLWPPGIVSASLQEGTARIGVLFESLQIHVVRDHEKNIVEGDSQTPRKVRDHWIFEREMSSSDLNWALAEISDG